MVFGIMRIHFLVLALSLFLSLQISPSATLANDSSAQASLQTPPQNKDVEWLKVPYEKVEDELLSILQKDLPKIEHYTTSLLVYEVRINENLPPHYQRNFRQKLERTLLFSNKLQVKQCLNCDEARLTKSGNGQLRFENYSSDTGRAKRISSEAGTDHVIYADLNYTPEDLILNIRLVRASTDHVLWSQQYSMAQVVRDRENLNEQDPYELGHRDSLSHVILGETAFALSTSFGLNSMPGLDIGGGSNRFMMPALDLFIGERFDRGRKLFGFVAGIMFNVGIDEDDLKKKNIGKPIGFAAKLGPKFTYIFNPYNISTMRFALATEAGALLGLGFVTPYIGMGPEFQMIRRFSFSLMPIYIFKTSVLSDEILKEINNGEVASEGSDKAGTFGGLGLLFRLSMTW